MSMFRPEKTMGFNASRYQQATTWLLTLIVLILGTQILMAQDAVINGKLLPKKKVFVGGDNNYRPYTYLDEDGIPRGLDVDIIKTLAQEKDLELEFNFTQWGDAIENLKTGKTDVLLGIMYSKKREQIFEYTIPHTTEYHAIFVRKYSGIHGINDLAGKVLMAQKGDLSYETMFKPIGLVNTLVYVTSLPEGFRFLNSGRNDFIIAPYSIGMEAIEKLPVNRLKVIGPPILPSVYRFAVKKGNSQLLTVLNEGLDNLKVHQQIEPLQKKWMKHIRKDLTSEVVIRYAIWITIPLTCLILALFLWSWTLKKEVKKKSKHLVLARKAADSANLAKSDFLAKLSHEIRTPLNLIIGFSQILKDYVADNTLPEKINHYVNNIELSSASLLMLVNDVLDLSKIEAGKSEINIEEINLNDLMTGLYDINKDRALSESVILSYALDSDLPKVILSDRSLLLKIIGNLLSNAIKFTPPGKNIWLKAKLADQHLALQIEDEGIGIPSEKLKLIFRPFEQLGKSQDKILGTGLGLAIVKENVNRLGGEVDVKSLENYGTCFTIHIPLNAEKSR